PGPRRPRCPISQRGRAAGARWRGAAAGRWASTRRARRAGMTGRRAMIEQLPTSDQRGGVLTDLDLERLQWTTLLYDLHEVNPDNGLIRDKTDPAAPSSIAATGLALATLPLMAHCELIYRPFAAKRVRRALRLLHAFPQGPEPPS